MLAENRQQSSARLLRTDPGRHFTREIVQAFSARCYMELVRELLHSTVTLLARLRGWSTSQPRRTAT